MVGSGRGPTTMAMSMSFSFCWLRQLLSVVLVKLEAIEVGFSFSQLKHDIHVFPGISMNTKIGQPPLKNRDVEKSIYLELRGLVNGLNGISDLKSFYPFIRKS